MSIATAISGVVTGLFKPAADAYGKRTERKMAEETARAKLLQARQDGNHQIALTELELIAISKKNEASTWKDEYALVLGSSPYILIFVGCILSAFGLESFQLGVVSALASLADLGVPVGEICAASIGAGLGLRLIKR